MDRLPSRGGFPALFLVALVTIMFQVLLTRVFSLTMWYHFAFMAISIAMFGMTIGALVVFLRPAWWPTESLANAMGRCAVLCAISIVGVTFFHISLDLPRTDEYLFLPIVVTFVCAAVPFLFAGIFVCLALTRFPQHVGKLYAADLAGAAVGCLGVIAALRWLDGVGAVLAAATLAALAGVLSLQGKQRTLAAAVTAALAGTTIWSGFYLDRHEISPFNIESKSYGSDSIEYERWNSFSRITVLKPEPDAQNWSLSSTFRGSLKVPSRLLTIDAIAGTQLIGFDGDLKKVEFLRWDLPNFVHHLRRDARVAIVGPGGGRDVLTAKLFGQKSVLAVEINGDILRVVNERYGDFTGHLHRDPSTSFINDEARSYLAREQRRFDILELTFIDTFAATAAGAYTLTENSLYTVEGWKVFLNRLDDQGLLAVSRAVNAELGRLVALGRAALLGIGAAEPERHMVLLTNRLVGKGSFGAMGLLLVRKTPFPHEELAHIQSLADRMSFAVELQPGAAKDKVLLALASGRGAEELLASGQIDYNAPTDDKPFFFHMARPSAWMLLRGADSSPASGAAVLLMKLLIAVSALTLLCIILPLFLSGTRLARKDTAFLSFFAAIGTGFMLIEVSMLQRLIIFLGHPVYSLSVVLFVLLLTAGLGSYLSARVPDGRLPSVGLRVLIVLTVVLALAGLTTAPVIELFSDAQTPVRVAVSGALLAVMGLFMGMAFPTAMRLAMASRPELGPWLWGVNGATSVLASVLAVVIAMAAGISTSFWAGVASYVVAVATFAIAARARLV
jgi:hypothetical protein